MHASEQIVEVKMAKNSQETRIALLEQSQGHIRTILSRIEQRFDSVDKKFDKIDDQFKGIRSEIHSLRQENWNQMRWILIFIIGFMGSPIIGSLLRFIHSSV